MMGLLFFGVLGCWVWLVYKIVRNVFESLASHAYPAWIGYVVLAALLPLPFIDELIAGVQLQYHCHRDGGVQILVPSDRLRKIVAIGRPEYRSLPNIATRGVRITESFVETGAREVVLRYVTLRVGPGIVARTLLQKQPLLVPGDCPSSDIFDQQLPSGFVWGREP